MTLAQTILNNTANAIAVTYTGGYAVMNHGMSRYVFEPAHAVKVNRNHSGRVTFGEFRWSDGSRLIMQYDEARGLRRRVV